jgi:hypothetical protein
MHPRSLASAEVALRKRRTRREAFLAEMEPVVPWARPEAVIEPLHLREVFQRIAEHPIERTDELLPWNIGLQPEHRVAA